MSHVSSSGKWAGIHILELQVVVFSSFISKPRVILKCFSQLYWSAKPRVLGQEERKYVLKLNQMHQILSNMRAVTHLSVFLKGCFSSLPFTSRACLKKLLLAGVPRRKSVHFFTYVLLSQPPSFTLWSPEAQSASHALTAGICYNCTSCLLQSWEPLLDQTLLEGGRRAFAVRKEC